MRRSVVTTTAALCAGPRAGRVCSDPAAGQPPAGQPPAGQPPAGQAPAPPAPAHRRSHGWPSPARLAHSCSSIKPDQTAAFEELATKVKAAMTASDNPVRKQQAAGWQVFKAAEPSGTQRALPVHGRPGDSGGRVRSAGHSRREPGHRTRALPRTRRCSRSTPGVFANVSRLNLTPIVK